TDKVSDKVQRGLGRGGPYRRRQGFVARGAIGGGALAVGQQVRKCDATVWTGLIYGSGRADVGTASLGRTMRRRPLASSKSRRERGATAGAIFCRVRRRIFDF